MLMSGVSREILKDLVGLIQQRIRNVNTFEEASQSFCEEIYKAFPQSVVLVRIFVTVPYGRLTEKNKGFVKNLLNNTKDQSLLKDDTKILSLSGTYGKNDKWNSRLLSKGHVRIPLTSETFIRNISMMNRLFQQLGVDLSLSESSREKTKSSFSGLFYVKDAKNEVDEKGRNVIANIEFVQKYGIHSVFGFGGKYLESTDFFSAIVF